MNRQQYEQYERDVAAFMKSEGLNCLSVAVDSGAEATSEPYFSSRQCDCCGSTLGGDRYKCSGFNPTTQEIQDDYEVCTDCVYYAAYGELGDDIMMDLDPAELVEGLEASGLKVHVIDEDTDFSKLPSLGEMLGRKE